MLKELLEAISQQAVKATGIHVTSIDGDPTRVLISHNGEMTAELLPNYRDHHIESLDSLIAALDRWCKSGTVWHNHSSVTANTDDGDRRDTIVLRLQCSEQFLSLSNLSRDGLTQREAIRLLRHDLEGCSDGTLLPLIRRVEFSSGGKSRADIEKGRESLGKSVEAAVSIADDLPDHITFSVPVYKTHGVHHRVDVTCSLDVHLQTERFIIMPLPNQLQNAIDEVQSDLHEALSATKVPTFYGSP